MNIVAILAFIILIGIGLTGILIARKDSHR